jgi:ribosomal-protein-alanine N-acetyltransferase
MSDPRPIPGERPKADALFRLHRRCFSGNAMWSARAFAHALNDDRFVLLHAPWPPATVGRAEVDEPGGFVLGRVAVDEADMLTLAIQPALRRRGMARALVTRFEATMRARGARMGYLEVAEDNLPGRALYRAAGWEEAGRRPGYYRAAKAAGPGAAAVPASGVDAVLMRKRLA